jgi:Leucine-rich repeat (LRR) protein
MRKNFFKKRTSLIKISARVLLGTLLCVGTLSSGMAYPTINSTEDLQNPMVKQTDTLEIDLTIDLTLGQFEEEKVKDSLAEELKKSLTSTDFPNLRNLKIYSDKRFKNSLDFVCGLTELEELTITCPGFSIQGDKIRQLDRLKRLHLSKIGSTSLPSAIWELNNLKILSIKDNTSSPQLSSLSSDIVKLKDLQELQVLFTQLTELPGELGQLTNLTKIHVQKNKLIKLSAELGNLENLTHLDASENELTTFPVELGRIQ